MRSRSRGCASMAPTTPQTLLAGSAVKCGQAERRPTVSPSDLCRELPACGHRGRGPRPRVQERPARGRRHRPPGRARGDLRLPRAERRGQVDDRADAHHAAAADRGHGAGGGPRHRARGTRGARGDRRRAAGGGARPAADRARSHAAADDAAGPAEGRARALARRRAARARRAHRRRRPQGRRLLGRHEAPARPRAGARALARACCSSTSRPPASIRPAAPTCGPRSRGSRARTA